VCEIELALHPAELLIFRSHRLCFKTCWSITDGLMCVCVRPLPRLPRTRFVAVAWRLSARRPIYAVLLFLLVIIGFESLGKDGWELGFVAKERLDGSAQWVDMIDGDQSFLGKYVKATDERVTFMGRFTANQTEGSVQFDNTGTVFGLQFRRSAMLYVFYREVRNTRFPLPSRLHVCHTYVTLVLYDRYMCVTLLYREGPCDVL
jgi:hypothetical protein